MSSQKHFELHTRFQLKVPRGLMLTIYFCLITSLGSSPLNQVTNLLAELIQTHQEQQFQPSEPLTLSRVNSSNDTVLNSEFIASDDSHNHIIYEMDLHNSYYLEVFVGLVDSIEMKESGGNPHAVSQAGAHGLFQIMPSTLLQWFDNNPDLQRTIAHHMLHKFLTEQLTATNGNIEEAVRRVASIWYSGSPELCSSTVPEYSGGIEFPSVSEYCNDILKRFQSSLE